MNSNYRKVGLLFLISIAFITKGIGQRGFFIMGGADMGERFKHYQFQDGGNRLSKGWMRLPEQDHDADDTFPYRASNARLYPELSLNYFFFRHFGLSLGLNLSNQSIVVHDKYFMDQHKLIMGTNYDRNVSGMHVSNGNFSAKEWYINPTISGCFIFNDKVSASGPYIAFGMGYNQLISRSSELSGTYFFRPYNEYLELKTNFLKYFNSNYIEMGILLLPDNPIDETRPGLKMASRESVMSIALRYTRIGNYATADYRDIRNNKVQYTDHMSAGGGYVSLVLKFGGGIFNNAVDHAYLHSYENKIARIENRKEDSIRRSKILFIPKKIGNRPISFSKEIKVRRDSIKIYIWDHGRYDDDVVSLNLNGNWILEDQTLTPEKQLVDAHLREGVNFLVFHAISEGSEKPCTLSVLIDDGVTQQYLILNSSMNESDAIKIHYNP